MWIIVPPDNQVRTTFARYTPTELNDAALVDITADA